MNLGRKVSLEELRRWGVAFGADLKPGCSIALHGELGAGKTTLAQAICEGYGVREAVTSPTFALVHVYEAPKSSVHHVDLYRLEGPHQLQNIGWDDIVRDNSVLIVEWPERAGKELPDVDYDIELRGVSGDPDRRLLSWGSA